MARSRLPKTIEQKILLESRRRCALCWGLESDLGVKKVQIAHIDRDSTNNSPSNLVALCLPHHDEYDTTPRQTKRLSEAEVVHFRGQLYEILALKQRTVKASFIGGDGSRTRSLADTRHLGMVVRAYDVDSSRSKPNGIKLLTLVRQFLTREGDFVACQEAIRCLARLAVQIGRCGSSPRFLAGSGSAIASPIVALAEAFSLVQQTDLSLSIGVRILLTNQALYEGNSNFFTRELSEMPGPLLEPYCTALYGVIMAKHIQSKDSQRRDCLTLLMELFCQATAIFTMRGFELPSSIKCIYYDVGSRSAPSVNALPPDDELLHWPPDVWFAILHMIALLPPEYFEAGIKLLNWKPADRDFLLAVAGGGDDIGDCKKRIDSLLLHPTGLSIVGVPPQNPAFVGELTSYIDSRLASVGTALRGLVQCLTDEREILCRP